MAILLKWIHRFNQSLSKFQNKSLYKLKIIILALYENIHTHTPKPKQES